MHRFVRKFISISEIKRAGDSSTKIFPALQSLQSLKSLSTDTSCNRSRRNRITTCSNQQSSFTFRDLIVSCGLSHQIVTRSKSSGRSDSVFKFLDSYGFSKTQIKIIVSRYPRILSCSVQKTLEPRIDFFRSVGISEVDVVNIITKAPFILFRSLKKHLIPSFDVLKTLLGDHQKAVDAIKSKPIIICCQVYKNLSHNVEILKNVGIPNSRVLKMITGSAMVVAGSTPHRLSEVVTFVKEMGFDPSFSSFEHAVVAKARASELTWKDKLNFYGGLGFSDEEILSMFRKQPISMWISEKKIRGAVEFFVNKFHWTPSQLSKRPNVLMYSLEKRIIPRCSVLQLLASRSIIGKNVQVSSILVLTERDFLQRYVINYEDEVPEVLDAYHNKLKFDEYNFDF